MDLFEIIKNRRSFRGNYLSEPVPRRDLEKIITAGTDAPSGCNLQTTYFVGIDDPLILSKIKAVIDPPIAESAPAMICVLTDRRIAYRDRSYAVQDYAAAIENMLLAITALGYQSCWYEGHITDEDCICDRIAEVLGVPSDYDVVCILPVGKTDESVRSPLKKSFHERAWFNHFTEK